MKKLWIVYDKSQYSVNSWFANRLLEKLSGSFDANIVIIEDIKTPQDEVPEVAVMRTINPGFSKMISEKGVRVVNPARVSYLCNDKSLSYKLAEEAGVPFAKVFDLSGELPISEADYPLVVKTAAGHGGKEVFLCRNAEELFSVKERLKGAKLIGQELIGDGRSGRDLRVYVLGGKIYKSVLRVSENDFRSNFSLGGRAEPYELKDSEKRTVTRILDVLGESDLIGVDFLVSEEGLLFNEIEDVVGTRMLYSVYGIPAADVFAEYIIKNC